MSRFVNIRADRLIKGDQFLCPNTGIWREIDSILSSEGRTRIVYSLGLGGYECTDGHKSVIRPRKGQS